MLVRLTGVTRRYGAVSVLRGADFELRRQDRVGMVGRNGAGKTTLVKILAGDEQPDGGRRELVRGGRIGYLPQEVGAVSGRPVFEEVLSAVPEMARMESRLRELEHEMEHLDGEALELTLHRYGEAQELFERADGYSYRSRAEAALQGLGLPKDRFDLPSNKLSGGQKSRLLLAKLLLSEPDALLLDEPTNHLDIEAIEWLEEFLLNYPKAFLLVSHDRYFLDRTVSRIDLVERGRVISYQGNYTKFRKLHEAETVRMAKEFAQHEKLVAKTKGFIRKNIAGQKTKQAKSRIKMLERLDPKERPIETRTHAAFRFRVEERSGDRVIEACSLDVGYGKKKILKGLDLFFKRTDRVGLVGPNGCGKTTLLKTLAGRLPPLGGEAKIGSRVKLGYFDQEQGDLDDDLTVLDTIWGLERLAPEVEMRNFLGLFDFSEDRVFVPVGELSGGERGRLQLARIVKMSPNLLLLDEPTNHLDLNTREALEAALAEFTGTLIVVSHDRYFLDCVCNKILEIKGETIESYPGNFTEYREACRVRAEQPAIPARGQTPTKTKRHRQNELDRGCSDAPSLDELEREIISREEELAALGEKLARGGAGAGKLKKRYERCSAELDRLNAEWDRRS